MVVGATFDICWEKGYSINFTCLEEPAEIFSKSCNHSSLSNCRSTYHDIG